MKIVREIKPNEIVEWRTSDALCPGFEQDILRDLKCDEKNVLMISVKVEIKSLEIVVPNKDFPTPKDAK